MSNSGSHKIWVAHYPEAQSKIDYYAAIIKELEGYRDDANDDVNGINQSNYQGKVENTAMQGPYYDTYVTHKDKWFSDLATMKSTLSLAVQNINTGISDANKLKADWENKKNEGHWESV